MFLARIEMNDGRGPMSNWCSPLRDALNDLWALDRDAYPSLQDALRYSGIATADYSNYRCSLECGVIDFSASSCRVGLNSWFGPDLGRDWHDDEEGSTDEGRAVHALLRSYEAQVVVVHIERGTHMVEGRPQVNTVECNSCSAQVVYRADEAVEVARIDVPTGDDWPSDAAEQLLVVLAPREAKRAASYQL